MTAKDYYTEQAKFNKWLNELAPHELAHVIMMMEEYADQQAKEAYEAGVREGGDSATAFEWGTYRKDIDYETFKNQNK